MEFNHTSCVASRFFQSDCLLQNRQGLMGQYFLWSCLGHVCDDMKCHAPVSKIIRWLKQLVVGTCKTSPCLPAAFWRWMTTSMTSSRIHNWKVDLDSSVTWWERPMWFQFFVGLVKVPHPNVFHPLWALDTFPPIILNIPLTHLLHPFRLKKVS